METVDSADGTPIAFEPSGSGPPIVLVHGATADHTRWEPIRVPLAEGFTVLAMDRRGRGASGDAADYAIEREFEDVAAVAGAASEPAVVFGHSYGALCALGAAPLTGAVRALVLYEPPLAVEGHALSTEAALAGIERHLGAGDDERALEAFLREIAKLPSPLIDRLRRAPNWPMRVGAASTLPREARAPAAYGARRFVDVTVPTLLLTGTESPAHLREAIADLADALPDARLVEFDGHGHAADVADPDRVADVVFDFVTELE